MSDNQQTTPQNPAPATPATSASTVYTGPSRDNQQQRGGYNNRNSGPGGQGANSGGRFGDRRGPGGGNAPSGAGGNDRGGRFSRNKMRGRPERRGNKQEKDEDLESKIIIVRRVTRVTKGGKKMRFSAMVVAGDRKGRVGYAIRKGVDFQSALNKATKKAQQSLIKIDLTEDGTLKFPSKTKFKAAQIFMKPAKPGTGLIAGGYLRPVLELAGIQNVYSKIIGGRNKISGVQAAMSALEKYKSDVK